VLDPVVDAVVDAVAVASIESLLLVVILPADRPRPVVGSC
jgi:hypothetical protein